VKERGREKLGRAGLMGRKRELGHAVNTGRMRERGRKKAGGCYLGWKKGGGPHGKEKKRGRRDVGRREVGPRGEKERRGWLGWAGLEKRREGEKRYFFKHFFQLFQTFEIGLFSKHSKIFKIILKAFKTSHKQIIKPCIQIMMHKHLLLLNILKAKFI
jgi:hypothetical protein